MRALAFESVDYLTQEEFFDFVQEREAEGDLTRYELLNGRVVAMSPAGYPHGSTEARVIGHLLSHAHRHGGEVFGSSQGFELPSGDTVEPDASFVSTERLNAAPPPEPGRFLRVVPDLVVEILSPKTVSRDRGEKKGIYERNGVREYWLVDPRALNVRRFVLEEGRYDTGRLFDLHDTFESHVLPGLTFPVASIFPD